MRRLRITREARADSRAILEFTRNVFGVEARKRYHHLIQSAFAQLRADPMRAGARRSGELPPEIWLYHLRYARQLMGPAAQPENPRHFVIFQFDSAQVTIIRILHESMDLKRHLRPAHE